MPNNDEMTIDERYKYLRIRQKKYRKGGRLERTRMLDEMEQVTGLHRKTLIRHMRGRIERKRRKRQRGRVYGSAVDDALRVISESHDYICAERLTSNLVGMAQHLAAHQELTLNATLLEQLARISVSTVKRKLRCFARLDQWRLPRRRGPKPPNPVTRDIPMGRIPWNEAEPGHLEADLVHHCGPSLCGDYVCTVQLADAATGWCEQAAVLGHSQRVMQNAFEHILARLPFPIREIHPDNGSEFFNHHLLRFWKDAVPGVRISRSRPFHKNDNRFVEQKNSSLVRAFLGHRRFDTVAQTCLLNQLYDKIWLPKVQLLRTGHARRRQDRYPGCKARLEDQTPLRSPAYAIRTTLHFSSALCRATQQAAGTARYHQSAKTAQRHPRTTRPSVLITQCQATTERPTHPLYTHTERSGFSGAIIN